MGVLAHLIGIADPTRPGNPRVLACVHDPADLLQGAPSGVVLTVRLEGMALGLFGKQSSDEEDWTTDCRNCGSTAVNRNFCSDACHSEFYEERDRARWDRPNTNPNCPACSGTGSCKLCEGDD